ncbi:suppressor of gamma response 1 [Tanacetum coccineum]
MPDIDLASQDYLLLSSLKVNQAWTGLPRGVKFDPLDHQIIWHLLAKSGASSFQPKPSTDEFIPTVMKDEGISYKHPQKLPYIVLARATYVPGDLDSAVADRIDEVLEFPLPGVNFKVLPDQQQQIEVKDLNDNLIREAIAKTNGFSRREVV